MTAVLAFDLLPGADAVAAVNALRRTALVVTSVDAIRGCLLAAVEAETVEALTAAALLMAARPEVCDLGLDAAAPTA